MRVKFDYIYCVICYLRNSYSIHVGTVSDYCESPVATIWFMGEEYTWEDRIV
jgi:hypothetical protein